MSNSKKTLEDYIISIPDFPAKGILFRDVTGIMQDGEGMRLAIDELDKLLDNAEFDAVAGLEARGFIFGAPLAYKRGVPFIPIRKKGKLPRKTVTTSYDLEYGKAEIEMNIDAFKPGSKIVLIDDLVATGGSAAAGAELIEKLDGEVVKMIFIIELAGLNGRDKLKKYDVESLIRYEGK